MAWPCRDLLFPLSRLRERVDAEAKRRRPGEGSTQETFLAKPSPDFANFVRSATLSRKRERGKRARER
jgi:hypothetical protein